VIVIKASADNAGVPVAVEDGVIAKPDLVDQALDGVVAQGILGVERRDANVSFGHNLTREVYPFQVAPHPKVTVGREVGMVHEARAEALDELSACMMGGDAEVDIVAFGRYIAVDVRGSHLGHDAPDDHGVYGLGIDIYLFLCPVPSDVGI